MTGKDPIFLALRCRWRRRIWRYGPDADGLVAAAGLFLGVRPGPLPVYRQPIVCISGTVDKIAAADVHIAAEITVIGGSSLLGKAMESLLSNTP